MPENEAQQQQLDYETVAFFELAHLVTRMPATREEVAPLLRPAFPFDPTTEDLESPSESHRTLAVVAQAVLVDRIPIEQLAAVIVNALSGVDPLELASCPEFIEAAREMHRPDHSTFLGVTLKEPTGPAELTDAPAVEWDDPILAPPQGFTVDEPKRR